MFDIENRGKTKINDKINGQKKLKAKFLLMQL